MTRIDHFRVLFLALCCSVIASLGLLAQDSPTGTPASLVTVLTSPDASVFEKAKACEQLAIFGDERSVPALADLLTDDKLSSYARDALEAIPGEASDAALRDAIAHLEGDRLIDVLASIGVRRDAQAVGVIAALLRSDDEATAAAAARSLGRIGSPQAADELQKMLSEATAGSGITLANACMVCIQQLAKQGRVKDAVTLYDAIEAADLPASIKSKATYNIILVQGDEGLPKLIELLEADDESNFRLALQAIRHLKIDASPELQKLFHTVSPERQVLLLQSLEELGNKTALPTVMKAAQAEDSAVRMQAIRALATVGNETAVPLLLEVGAESDEELAETARSILAALPFSEIDTAILSRLTSNDIATQQMAIDVAAQRRIAEASATLFQLAASDDDTTRKEAINALAATIRMEHLADFISVVMKEKRSLGDVAMRSALTAACVRMPQEGCAKKLTVELATAELATAPPTAKKLLLEQLVSVGGATALETVVSAARSNDPTMQDEATRLLGEWLTADAAPALLDLATTLTERKYQIRALRGCIRIARQLNMTPEERIDICHKTLAIASRPEDKALILDVLKRHPSREGLQLAEELLEDPELRATAQPAIRLIKEKVGEASVTERGL